MKTITVTKADYDESVAAHGEDADEAFTDNWGCPMCKAAKRRNPKAKKISVDTCELMVDDYVYKFETPFRYKNFQELGTTGKSFKTNLI